MKKLQIVFKNILTLVPLFIFSGMNAQTLSGKITEWDEIMKMEMPLPGANVHWMNTSTGTATDAEGSFNIEMAANLPAKLIISFVGFENDTINIVKNSFQKVLLKKSVMLQGVDIKAKLNNTFVSTLNPLNVEKINQGELLKAACCNLSESFETSATVNVAYRDAITGAKEIQLLGLAGTYSQLLTENIPNMRGIAGIYGLTFIPGPWMESIQVTKGSGSVVNGYESTTGQLNVEFKKPQDSLSEKFYLNLYGANSTNTELNSYWRNRINNKWSTMTMVHGDYMNRSIDRNGDGFHDMPHNKQINLYNRWNYHSGRKTESQIGVKYLYDQRHGGQIHPEDDDEVSHDKYYLMDVTTERVEAFAKLGFVFPEKPGKSIGNILQVTYHDMQSSFGKKSYNANEKTLYYQSIYQNILGSTNHQYKIGWTFQYDYLHDFFKAFESIREEEVPGVFAEYTYSYLKKLSVVAGVREDYHSGYDWVFTPRIHTKYNFTENFIVRASAGKSFRTSYLIADNISVLASSRKVLFPEIIQPERAWNYGINFTKKFLISDHEGSISADFYRTDFISQVIADLYSDTTSISFYNLKGKSFANSLQVSFKQELREHFDLRLAYKFDDVQETFNGVLEQKPLASRDRALMNLAYATPNEHWKFDGTLIWEGKKKLANAAADAETGVRPQFSPDFFLVNLQATKVFRRFDVYAGSENIFDFRQLNPIINASQPFSNSFDASQVWGPVEGRRIYAGLRFVIN